MLKLFTASMTWAGIVLSLACYGQAVHVLPLGALPMQFNSSFAGEAGAPRISSNVGYGKNKNNWNRSLFTSYDQFIPALRSGIGITAGLEGGSREFPSVSYNLSYFSLVIAPKISIKGKYTLSPSLDFIYNSQRSQIQLLTSTGQKDQIKGNVLQSRAGLLFNTNKYYIGFSVYLVDHINVDDGGGSSYSGRRYRFDSHLQLGYTFQKSSESKFSVTPQIAFRLGKLIHPSGNNYPINLFEAYNLTFKYDQVIWGINNSGFHVGWQNEKIRLIFSNKLNLGIFGDNTPNSNNPLPYSSNLSFRYIFKK